MVFIHIFVGVVAVCKNWFRLTMNRFVNRRRTGPTAFPVPFVELRAGARFALLAGRVGPSDLLIINEVWYRHYYDPPELQIAESDIVLDIGANKGFFSIYAAMHASKGRVYAFEPAPQIFAMLRENIRLNNLENIVAEQCAVAETNGVRKLYLSGSNDGGHSLHEDFFLVGQKYADVRTVTLAEALDRNAIQSVDFMKVDCEGGEYGIILTATSDMLRRVRKISMEYHDHVNGHRYTELVDVLRRSQFDVRVTDQYIHAVQRDV